MRTTSILCHLLTISLLLVGACRGGDDGDDVADDDVGDDVGDDTVDPNDVTIYEIQGSEVTEGETITVKGVIVTAIDTYGERDDGSRTGTIYVQEPDGGPYSGVLVYGGPADQVATLAVGDVVDIAGAGVTEFALDTDTSGLKTTELQPGDSGTMQITRVSSGTAPEPELVDVIAIAQLEAGDTHPNAQDNEWEKWEGVLIRVENVAQVGDSEPISDTMNPNFYAIQLSPGNFESDTSLTPFPTSAVDGTCFASITGLGDYFYNWKVQPRSTDDFDGGGTGCPAQEEGDAACGNGEDDDFDGFTDCEDFSCQDTSAACVTDTNIAAVQMGTTTGVVSLENVVVTGVTFNRSNLYIADALAAAPYAGVLVYRGGSSVEDLPPEIEPGAIVNVTGTVTEYMDYTELTNPTVTFVSAPAGSPTPVASTIETLITAATGEPFEGVYTTLTNVRVTEVVDAGMDHYFQITQGTSSIYVDDDIYRAAPVLDDCYASISGFFGLNTFTTPIAPHINFLPTKAEDIVAGGTCD